MSNRVRIVLIILIMVLVIGASYWYMQETTGRVEEAVEKKWRLHDNLLDVSFSEDTYGRLGHRPATDVSFSGESAGPRWPLENPPPVAGSKSPTPRQQNGCKLIQFLF